MRTLLTAAALLTASMASAQDLEVPPQQLGHVSKGMFCNTAEQVEEVLEDIAARETPDVEGCGLVRLPARVPVVITPLHWHDNGEVQALIAKLEFLTMGKTQYGWVDIREPKGVSL